MLAVVLVGQKVGKGFCLLDSLSSVVEADMVWQLIEAGR